MRSTYRVKDVLYQRHRDGVRKIMKTYDMVVTGCASRRDCKKVV